MSSPLEPPTLSILLLGDQGVGKSTFLSRLAHGPTTSAIPPGPLPYPITLELRRPPLRLELSAISTLPSTSTVSTSSTISTISTLTSRTTPTTTPHNEKEPDDDAKTWNSTPNSGWSIEKPDIIILCYDISSPRSLRRIRDIWAPMVARELNKDEGALVLLLGLRRDLRTESREVVERREAKRKEAAERSQATRPSEAMQREDTARNEVTMPGIQSEHEKQHESQENSEEEEKAEEYTFVLPQQGLSTARNLHCDRYAECSSLTGELVREVWEDVVGMAVGVAEGMGLGVLGTGGRGEGKRKGVGEGGGGGGGGEGGAWTCCGM